MMKVMSGFRHKVRNMPGVSNAELSSTNQLTIKKVPSVSSARISTSSSSSMTVGCDEGWDDERELSSEEGCDEEGDRRELLCSEGELLSCEDGSEEGWGWELGIDEASAGDADGLFSRMRLLSFPPPRSEVAALTDSAHKMMARKQDARMVALDSCIMEMKRVYVMLFGLHFLCGEVVLRSRANSITQATNL
jgi:hypothetical protein